MTNRLATFAFLLLSATTAQAQLLDDFESVAGWQAAPSDGVELRISADEGRRGRAMRLDFDFRGGAGYAIARKNLTLELPDNFEFSFWMRAEAPVNNLEFKLVDPSGENVWWVNRRDFDYPRAWRRISLKKRHFSFAWGPAGGGEPRRLGAIEIVVTAGTGGKGTVWVDELALTPLPPRTATPPPPRLSASSARPGREAARAMDGNTDTIWRSSEQDAQWIEMDLVERRDFGGLVIDWGATQFATNYDVQIARDGEWESVYQLEDGNGGRDFIYLPESEARRVRLRLVQSSQGRGYAIRELAVKPIEWSDSLNTFWASVAADSRRGDYPRYLYNEQSYWTIVGVDGDTRESLLSEDGSVESGKAGFSIEPFLYTNGRLLTWADVSSSHSLADGYLPVPTVTWGAEPFRVMVTSHAEGEPEKSTVYVRYRISSESAARRNVTLFLALRPFQVNPSWQFLSTIGGFAPIRRVEFDGKQITVNEEKRVVPLSKPVAFGAAMFDHGNIVEFLRRGQVPAKSGVEDLNGFASAALSYRLSVSRNAPAEVIIAVPLHADSPVLEPQLESTLAQWRQKLNRVTIRLPQSEQRIVDTIRSTLAYILINRDQAAIQPGSRSYERSWIRDGSLTSAALLRLGHADAVRQFIEWYAPYQFPNGKVPCCVDRRGADPVPEHDSHGQLIYLIGEYYRYTGDRSLLERMWPHVVRAVDYIASLRQERMTAEYASAEKRAFFGLVPESISHEGYSAKPMHSYWDDLFVLKGLKDATEIARALGKEDEAAKFAALRDQFRGHLLDSLARAMAAHKIDYLPGSVELGDFDATSTTVAVTPVDEARAMPSGALERTFEKYYENHVERRKAANWEAYTPYELRTVGTFVRLGQKERAHELLDFFFSHQRPRGWNHWAEVVFRNLREPKFIGDMPHTWVGSDFIRSLLDMFAYEQDDGSLVLGAGIPADWTTTEPAVVVEGLPTRFGKLNFTMRGYENEVNVKISGEAKPPAGIIVHSPYERPVRDAILGKQLLDSPDGKTILIKSLPADLTFYYQPQPKQQKPAPRVASRGHPWSAAACRRL